MEIREEVRKMKRVAPQVASSTLEQRNHVLKLIGESLERHKEEIFAANRKDLERAGCGTGRAGDSEETEIQ